MGAIRVFLDANVLFSASLGGAPFQLLWKLAEKGKVTLLSSAYCRLEAESNLRRKYPAALSRYRSLLNQVANVPEGEGDDFARSLLPEKDAPVLAAALASEATVLITGDRKHFGALMDRSDLPIKVCTVRDFLREGSN